MMISTMKPMMRYIGLQLNRKLRSSVIMIIIAMGRLHATYSGNYDHDDYCDWVHDAFILVGSQVKPISNASQPHVLSNGANPQVRRVMMIILILAATKPMMRYGKSQF